MMPTKTNAPATTTRADVFSVSQLNQRVKQLLEVSLNRIRLEGELSSWSRPASGHWYFTLKDDKAQVRCAMFRARAGAVNFQPKEGDSVEVIANVSLYEQRGDYQLIVERMKPAGEGALLMAFEALKRRLLAEGLFEPERKQPLPVHIKRVGVVTSHTGAALHDIVSVLARRNPNIGVIVYPTPVQGTQAPDGIVNAIAAANAQGLVDVLIVGRGGGSLEDLWGFNDERVARAIAHSSLPVVSAVGHEVDTTISDFVADVRAATPSAAAELVSVDTQAYVQRLVQLQQRLTRACEYTLERYQRRCQWAYERLADPASSIMSHQQRLDQLIWRLQQGVQARLQRTEQTRSHLEQRLHANHPSVVIQQRQAHLEHLQDTLKQQWQFKLRLAYTRMQHAAQLLHSLSPLQVLGRGYALAHDAQGNVITRADELNVGDAVKVRLHQGQLDCVVEQTHADGAPHSTGD